VELSDAQEEIMRRVPVLSSLTLIPALAFVGCTAQQQPKVAQKTTGEMAMPMTKGSLKVVSPKEGEKLTATDVPMQVAVSDFKVSRPLMSECPMWTGRGISM
jgi:hypothetical protein